MEKMIKIIPILTVILFACQTNKRSDADDTQLDKLIELASEVNTDIPTRMLNRIKNDLPIKWNIYETNNEPSRELKNDGLIEHKSFADTTTVPNIYITISAYKNIKSALMAFRDWVDFKACCIPDEDIVKLKNFENINAFKNKASKIILAENTIVTMYLGDRIEDNKKFNGFIDKYFENSDYKKLEIGTGGPAKWTKK